MLISLGIFQVYPSQWLSEVTVVSASNSVIRGWGVLSVIGTNLIFSPSTLKYVSGALMIAV